MRNSPFFISAATILGIAFFVSCNNPASKTGNAATSATTPTATNTGSSKLAYVDIDSLEEHYELLKSKREDFRKRQDAMESELQRSYQQMQNDAAEVQKKAQANTLSQTEYEAAQKRLMQMQQSLETRKQALTEQLMKDQDEFNKGLKGRLDSFIEDYNKTKNYDFIFSYSSAGSSAILHANKALDITQDVIKGMNDMSKGQEKKNK